MGAVDEFGKELVREVRDETVDDWEMMLDGRMKGDLAEVVNILRASFTKEQNEALKKLVRMVADTSLHHFMRMLEESDQIRLLCQPKGTMAQDVRAESDGLAGELYGPRGWIARFSKFPRTEPGSGEQPE